MKNVNYIPIQIPKKSYETLKLYCQKNGYAMGRFIAILIEKACKNEEPKKILKVEPNEKTM